MESGTVANAPPRCLAHLSWAGMDAELEAQLRQEILDRIPAYKKAGLKTGGILALLKRDGPLATLEHYSRDNTLGWWPLIVEMGRGEDSLEWVLVHVAAPKAKVDQVALQRAKGKLETGEKADAAS
jgi:hypothetical protein